MHTENFQKEYVSVEELRAKKEKSFAHYLILEVVGDEQQAQDVLSTIEKLELSSIHSATIVPLDQFAMRLGLL